MGPASHLDRVHSFGEVVDVTTVSIKNHRLGKLQLKSKYIYFLFLISELILLYLIGCYAREFVFSEFVSNVYVHGLFNSHLQD